MAGQALVQLPCCGSVRCPGVCSTLPHQRRADGHHKLGCPLADPAKGPGVEAAVEWLAGCQEAQGILSRPAAHRGCGVQCSQQVRIAGLRLELQKRCAEGECLQSCQALLLQWVLAAMDAAYPVRRMEQLPACPHHNPVSIHQPMRQLHTASTTSERAPARSACRTGAAPRPASAPTWLHPQTRARTHPPEPAVSSEPE